MSNSNIKTKYDIECLAMQGRALASILTVAVGAEGVTNDDLTIAASALEDKFRAIWRL
jgi:hypothetical protein